MLDGHPYQVVAVPVRAPARILSNFFLVEAEQSNGKTYRFMIDTGLTEEEFDRWAKESGWDVPRHIRWSFVPALKHPPVSDAAKDAIRVWPASRCGPT